MNFFSIAFAACNYLHLSCFAVLSSAKIDNSSRQKLFWALKKYGKIPQSFEETNLNSFYVENVKKKQQVLPEQRLFFWISVN